MNNVVLKVKSEKQYIDENLYSNTYET